MFPRSLPFRELSQLLPGAASFEFPRRNPILFRYFPSSVLFCIVLFLVIYIYIYIYIYISVTYRVLQHCQRIIVICNQQTGNLLIEYLDERANQGYIWKKGTIKFHIWTKSQIKVHIGKKGPIKFHIWTKGPIKSRIWTVGQIKSQIWTTGPGQRPCVN